MKKNELLKTFTEDFDKLRGSLNEQISHNRKIDGELVEDLSDGNFKQLEEHVEISKLILDSVKAMTELYKSAPSIIKSTQDLEEEVKKLSIDLNHLMKD